MAKISLKEHIEQSKIAVAANFAKGNRHGQILSMLYSDPFHFIEELIQNAEDALERKKTKLEIGSVKIILNEKYIDFMHNGDIFTEEDLMSITTFANTTKKGLPNINQIGKFGIGFKSVYGITNAPEIHSGIHHYKISDFEVLEETETIQNSDFQTIIRLPLKENLSKNYIQELYNNILNLDPAFILFLNQISQVEIISQGANYIISNNEEKFDSVFSKKTLTTTYNGNRKEKEYLFFSNFKQKNKKIAIAFEIDKYGNFIPEKNPFAYSFFKTKLKLSHHILVHASFTTTPNRENIPFEKEFTPENFELLENLAELVQKAINTMISKKIFSHTFWNLFAWDNENLDIISEKITNSLNYVLENNKCLISFSKKYLLLKNLCVAEDDYLLDLLKKNDIKNIYNREDFLSTDYYENENFILYLQKKLKLKTADIESFAYHIANSRDFLSKKPFSFFKILYDFLSKHPKLWDRQHENRYYNLRYKAFILDHNKNISAAFSQENKPKIFIGKPSKDIKCVHPTLAKDEKCNNFFSMFGILQLSPQINTLHKLISNFNEKSWTTFWLKIYDLYNNSENSTREIIHDKIKNVKSLLCVNSKNKTFVKPIESYIPSENICAFLKNTNALFISEKLKNTFSKNEIPISKLNVFLKEMGVADGLKIIPCQTNISEEEKQNLRAEINMQNIVKESITDYTIEGLEQFIEKPEIDSSVALLQLLENVDEKFFSASYIFESYTRTETKTFDSNFIKKLKSEKCFFDRNLNLISVEAVDISNLHAEYFKNHMPSKKIIHVLKMQDSELSEDERIIINKIREKKLSIPIINIIEKNNLDNSIIIKYKPQSAQTEAKQLNLNTDINTNIFANTINYFANSNMLNWESYLLSEKTEAIYEVLKKSNDDIKICQAGHIKIFNPDKVNIFIGIMPNSLESVFLPNIFLELWQKKEIVGNVFLYIFNIQDNIWLEIDKQDLNSFFKNNKITFLNSIIL